MRLETDLVSVNWLQKNIDNKDVVILDATIPKVNTNISELKEKKQIKNAIFFDIKNVFSDQNSKYPNTILSANKFEEEAQRIGINTNSCIVVYDDLGIYSSPRVWWLFKVFGFNNVAVLDGGLPLWIKEGGSVESKSQKKLLKGNFTSNYQKEKVSSTADVLEAIQKNSSLIIDARSVNRFKGIDPEPRANVRSGHIPNSKNLPYTTLKEAFKVKSAKELSAIFKQINPKNERMIFSCGSGITACILAFGASLCGYKEHSVYDGSWTEWGSSGELPIEQ